jgi:DHA3 family macrolide efflux protein-like MFS transporter
LLGFLSSFANGSLGSIVQTKVSPEMQGRVFTVMGSMAGMAVPLGLIIAGPLADKIGIQPLNLLAGLSGIAIGAAGFLSKDVRTLESQEPSGGSASDADNQPDFVS